MIRKVSERFDSLDDIVYQYSEVREYSPEEVKSSYSDDKERCVLSDVFIMSTLHDGLEYYTNHNITESKRDIIRIVEEDRWITITYIPEIDHIQVLLFKGEYEVYRTNFSFYRKSTRLKTKEFFAKIRHCITGLLYYFSDKKYFKEGKWEQLIVDLSFGFGSQIQTRCDCSFSKMYTNDRGVLNYIVYHKVNKDIKFLVRVNETNRFLADVFILTENDGNRYELYVTSVDNYLYEFSFLDYMVKEVLLNGDFSSIGVKL